MPDLERALREIEIDICDTEKEQDIIRAYHRGQDDARKEVAIVFGLIVAVFSGLFVILF